MRTADRAPKHFSPPEIAMATHQTSARVDATRELQTESIRLTGFLAPTAQVGDPTWWSDLTGSPAETRTAKPSRGELQEAGTVDDRTLTLAMQPGRVDWFLTPRFEQGVLPESPWAGNFREALDSFSALMLRWLPASPPLVRIAFGAVVHRPVADKAAGYVLLARYIPSLQIDPDSEDLWYQINRPRMSRAIEGLKINRLSRWSVAQFMSLRLAVTGRTLQPDVSGGQTSCRIELDLSTDALSTAQLEQARLHRLFDEHRSMAEEIAVQGDIP
jgi:hypothetical protein